MSHVIILAGSAQEANTYRQVADLPKGRAIYATSTAQIDGVVPSQVHTLPGFAKRRDNHAIKAALKRSSRKFQNVTWVTVDERGILSPRDLEVAYRYDRLRDLEPATVWVVSPNGDIEVMSPNDNTDDSEWDPEDDLDGNVGSAPVAETEPDPEPVKARRRSRCKDCGALHFSDEPCPTQVDPAAFFGGV